jgi:hypothetical protein
MVLGIASADLLLHPMLLRIIGAFLGGHRGHFAWLEMCRGQPERVGALDGAPDLVLGDYVEHSGPGQDGDVTVQAPGGNIVEFGGELTGGQRPIAEEHSSAFMAHVAGLLADFDRYLAAGTPVWACDFALKLARILHPGWPLDRGCCRPVRRHASRSFTASAPSGRGRPSRGRRRRVHATG